MNQIERSDPISIFRIIMRKYHEYIQKILNDYTFTPNEVSTMICLMENPEITTAKEISDKYKVTPALISRSVDSLTKKGYLKVSVDSLDRRVNHLTLNIEDKNLTEMLKELNENYLKVLYQDIPQNNVETFSNVLQKIYENIK